MSYTLAASDSALSQRVSPALPDTYAACDDFKRSLPLNIFAKNDKKVGIFYFLWHGEHGLEGPFDITKIIAAYPDAATNADRWGGYGVYHWWGEPLFGYYTNRDQWVMRKHIEMLTDAGIDFVVFDTTNRYTYAESAKLFLNLLLQYRAQGLNVPQVAFYTNTESGQTINELYDLLYAAHPEYECLWFRIDGKPLVIGLPEDGNLKQECRDYFRIKHSQWPTEKDAKGNFIHHKDGFPWISFENRQHHFNAVRPSVMSVSVAQHCNVPFSGSALYGNKLNHTRSWHHGANDPAKDAPLHGYNLAEQFIYAIRMSPDIIFITGWNEWIAGNWSKEKNSVLFVDCCDMNNSRDIEPMKGGFFDNYYLLMINCIRRFKGTTAPPVDKALNTIDIQHNGFADWQKATAVYQTYAGNTANRDMRGYGQLHYKDESGRNDFRKAAVAHDSDKLYFYIETSTEITLNTGADWMRLLIATDKTEAERWNGYDYVVNRVNPSENRCVLEHYEGHNVWKQVASCNYWIEGNKMHVEIPWTALGLSHEKSSTIQFKWSDNQRIFSVENAIEAFYTEGDAAPGGRLNFVYGY